MVVLPPAMRGRKPFDVCGLAVYKYRNDSRRQKRAISRRKSSDGRQSTCTWAGRRNVMGGTYHSTSDGRARRTVVVRGFSVATLSLFVVRQVSICSRVPSGGIKEVSSSSHSVCPSSFVIVVGGGRRRHRQGGRLWLWAGRADGRADWF